jgi:2-phospho-L-lactate guanylyltransferase
VIARPGWHVIVPLKSADVGKSRLGIDPAAVRALGVATVLAAAAARGVAELVVVTADKRIAEMLSGMPRVRVVLEHAAHGLRAAIAEGLATVPQGSPRAVLLGDLPALRPGDLSIVLAQAARHPRSYVADAAGTGTTLVTARPGVTWRAAFGRASASRHRALGLHRMPVSIASSVRHDVDTPHQLARARAIAASTISAVVAGSVIHSGTA